MRFAMAVLPLLKASRGVILNTASMLSYGQRPLVPAYGASKSGVLGLTRHLATPSARRHPRQRHLPRFTTRPT